MNFPYESLAYKALPIIMAMLLPSISLAQRITTDAPVLSSYADTEATTNVVFSAGDTDDRLFRLSLELNATADNNVSVVFGTDANANGVLDREEADAVVGWDSGSWFYQDRVSGAEAHTARTDGRCRLNWELTLNPHKAAKGDYCLSVVCCAILCLGAALGLRIERRKPFFMTASVLSCSRARASSVLRRSPRPSPLRERPARYLQGPCRSFLLRQNHGGQASWESAAPS